LIWHPLFSSFRRIDVTGEATGRPNQKARTRKDLLQAAARLMKRGRAPTLEEIAEEALVSRATAYRYFPSADSLLVEAAVDVAVPEPVDLFRNDASLDPLARLLRVETALDDMINANEHLLRTMLAHAIQQGGRTGDTGDLPRRQNRRTPLIEAALEPVRHLFKPAALRELSRSLALVMGPESSIVVKDVLQLDDADARRLKRWAIRALVEAARKPGA
jgi:AcrR family transcriptional regulator